MEGLVNKLGLAAHALVRSQECDEVINRKQ
jgi:hypothetical protein